MKGTGMDADWRILQVFLDKDMSGVFEVHLDSNTSSKINCNCPAYLNSKRCKHIKFVKDAMSENNGHYAIQIPAAVADEDTIESITNSEEWRKFIIKYAKVVVL